MGIPDDIDCRTGDSDVVILKRFQTRQWSVSTITILPVILKKLTLFLIARHSWPTFVVITTSKSFSQNNALDVFSNIAPTILTLVACPCDVFCMKGILSLGPRDYSIMRQVGFHPRLNVSLSFADIAPAI
jgi:hypothetical protein